MATSLTYSNVYRSYHSPKAMYIDHITHLPHCRTSQFQGDDSHIPRFKLEGHDTGRMGESEGKNVGEKEAGQWCKVGVLTLRFKEGYDIK